MHRVFTLAPAGRSHYYPNPHLLRATLRCCAANGHDLAAPQNYVEISVDHCCCAGRTGIAGLHDLAVVGKHVAADCHDGISARGRADES